MCPLTYIMATDADAPDPLDPAPGTLTPGVNAQGCMTYTLRCTGEGRTVAVGVSYGYFIRL